MPTPAIGANLVAYGQFESTWGVRSTDNYLTFRGYSFTGFAGQQPLATEPLLGAGREPSAPYLQPFDVSPSIVAPIDQRLLPYHLRSLLGPSQAAVQVGARGYIEFLAQPTAAQYITINGQNWTFRASGATGEETNIGASLQATIDALVTGLNASVDAEISPMTYSRLGNRLVIQHDTADTSGNSVAISAGTTTARVSKATLYGGGQYRHEFRSGLATDLPSMTFQIDSPALAGGNRYLITEGVIWGQLEIDMTRADQPRATFTGRGETAAFEASSVAGTPTAPTVALYSPFQSYLLVNDIAAEQVWQAKLNFDNGLLVNELLTDSGLIGGLIPGQISASLEISARFADHLLAQQQAAGNTVSMRFGYLDKVTGSEVVFDFDKVHLPRPAVDFSTAGFTDVVYGSVVDRSETTARSMTVYVYNDVASYA